MAIFRQGPPNGGVECRWVGTNRDRRRYSWLSIDDVLDLWTASATIHRAVYCTIGDASVMLYLSQPAVCTAMTKRREESRIYLYTQR